MATVTPDQHVAPFDPNEDAPVVERRYLELLCACGYLVRIRGRIDQLDAWYGDFRVHHHAGAPRGEHGPATRAEVWAAREAKRRLALEAKGLVVEPQDPPDTFRI